MAGVARAARRRKWPQVHGTTRTGMQALGRTNMRRQPVTMKRTVADKELTKPTAVRALCDHVLLARQLGTPAGQE
jgi:hypothetical protein